MTEITIGIISLIISLLAIVLAIIPLGIYFIQKLFYSSKVFFRIGGEQAGEPIQIPENGRVDFAVSTELKHKIFISEVWVSFDPDQVDLFKTRGAEKRGTLEEQFPVAILFPDRRVIKKDNFQGNYFDYETKISEFLIKLTAISEIDETELPLILRMFPTSKISTELIVKFKVFKDIAFNLQKTGLMLRPNESLEVEGTQAQEAVMASSEKETAKLRVIEIIEKRK